MKRVQLSCTAEGGEDAAFLCKERQREELCLFGFVGFARDLCKYSRLQTIWFSYFLYQKLTGKCNTFKPLFFATWKLKELSVNGYFELFLFGRSLSIFCFIRCELGAVEVCL